MLELGSLLEVERAEFEIEDDDAGAGFGADDVVSGFEGVDGGVAAHEADEGSFDGGVETEVIDDLKVEAGGVEAGAGSDDDVGDGVAFRLRKGEVVKGFAGQLGGEALEEFHAAGGDGEAAGNVEIFGVFPDAVFSGKRIDEGVAVLDGGEAGHAAEEIARGSSGEHGDGEVNEGVMDVVRGDGRGDAVDECCCHFGSPWGKEGFLTRSSEVYTVGCIGTGEVGLLVLMS